MKEYKYKINGNDYKVAVGDIEGNVVQVEVNGTPYNVEIEEKEVKKTTVASVKPAAAPRTDTGAKVIAKPAAASAGQAAVKSPLPGVINDIKVKVGDSVTAGSVVVILEAMKMENEIMSPCDGTVRGVSVSKGASVDTGAVLCTIA